MVKYFSNAVPAATPGKGTDAVRELGATVSERVAEYVAAMEKQRIKVGPIGSRGARVQGRHHRAGGYEVRCTRRVPQS